MRTLRNHDVYTKGYRRAIARVFKSGNRQAVRLPKKFHVKRKELEIEKRGNEIILREKPVGMERAFYLLQRFHALQPGEAAVSVIT